MHLQAVQELGWRWRLALSARQFEELLLLEEGILDSILTELRLKVQRFIEALDVRPLRLLIIAAASQRHAAGKHVMSLEVAQKIDRQYQPLLAVDELPVVADRRRAQDVESVPLQVVAAPVGQVLRDNQQEPDNGPKFVDFGENAYFK